MVQDPSEGSLGVSRVYLRKLISEELLRRGVFRNAPSVVVPETVLHVPEIAYKDEALLLQSVYARVEAGGAPFAVIAQPLELL